MLAEQARERAAADRKRLEDRRKRREARDAAERAAAERRRGDREAAAAQGAALLDALVARHASEARAGLGALHHALRATMPAPPAIDDDEEEAIALLMLMHG